MTRTLLALSLAGCSVADQIDYYTDTGDSDAPAADTDPGDTTDDLTDTDPASVPVVTDPIPFCINELMAVNKGSTTLQNGDTPDWIELYNPTDTPISLQGWTISDDVNAESPDLLDGLTLQPFEYLVVYASGDDTPGDRRMNFTLDDEGEQVTVRAPDARRMTVNFPRSTNDMAFARASDCCVGDCWTVIPYGTPAATNAAP